MRYFISSCLYLCVDAHLLTIDVCSCFMNWSLITWKGILKCPVLKPSFHNACLCVSTFSHSVVSDSLWPHRLQSTRHLCPWDFPGKNTGVGCHFLPKGSSQPRDLTWVSCVSCFGRKILYHWATEEIPVDIHQLPEWPCRRPCFNTQT